MLEPSFLQRVRACLAMALRPGIAATALAAASATAAGADNVALHETRWALQALDGVPVVHGGPHARAHLSLRTASQHLSGFAGCNRLAGRYTQRGTQLALAATTLARNACAPAQMQQEQRFIELLGAADAYRIEGAALSLLQGDKVRVRFEATVVK